MSATSRSTDSVLYPHRDWFTAWQERTGEQPPDFAAMPSMPDLPPLLQFQDGRPVRWPTDWDSRRAEIRALLEHYFWGRLPAEPPRLQKVEILAEEHERGVIRRSIALTFATEPVVQITIETMTPDSGGPFPLFLTQTTHRVWAVMGVSRGYMACVYPASDENDQSARFVEVYPDCDWTTIPRRAWLAGRALDYLLTLDEVDGERVAITGHSRNGKQSLIAAAIDERITSVVSSSSGAAGASPYRFTSEREFLESVETTTWMCPDWFHPRLRFFTGREDRLPIDTHGYLALIAPRACLLSTALNDGCESTFAVERAYLAAQQVYERMGRAEALRIRWRPGGHETRAEDIQSYFDWFDSTLGRGTFDFPEKLLHAFDWQAWRERAGDSGEPPAATPQPDRQNRLARVQWGLGEQPPTGVEWAGAYGSEKPHDALLMERLNTPEGVARLPVHFSDYLAGDLYYPAQPEGPLPVVIWLHPYSFPAGYPGNYVVSHDTWKRYYVYHELAQRGIACFAFDQLGFGRRIQEGTNFYQRYPRWSRLGKMVQDVRAAVDFLRAGEGRFPYVINSRFAVQLPELDLSRIYCLGYSLGGMVALYATALDERISGVASFCGFTPMRTDTDDQPTGGLRRLWEWYGLQPRLGLYAGRERELPYDFEDVLTLVAPRPCLIVSPTQDRDANVDDVTACVAAARPAWERAGAGAALTHLSPVDYSRFQPDQYRVFLDWLAKLG